MRVIADPESSVVARVGSRTTWRRRPCLLLSSSRRSSGHRSTRWANWLRQDPVVAIETQAENLRRLKVLYIACDEKDQFNLLCGARRFVRRLNELGIAHRYEEFPDNHTSVDYRTDESLPFLAHALTG